MSCRLAIALNLRTDPIRAGGDCANNNNANNNNRPRMRVDD
ncbi:hypothetical protein [Arenimonas daejeonensis]|nr:hypothetical protein [Arenimonas daejeonensis]